MTRLSFYLAWRDYWHEWLLSLCSILALLAVLTPLLVLGGVRFGIISSMESRLMDDPRNLEIIPAGSGNYTLEWLAALGGQKEVGFLIPQTRSIAASIDLYHNGQRQAVDLIPTAPGDPLLKRWGVDPAQWGEVEPGAAKPVPIVLTSIAAQRLNLSAEQKVEGRVGRVFDEKRESVSLPLMVAGVLPPAAQQKLAAYVPLSLLVVLEDYRDGRMVPEYEWHGQEAPLAQDRRFASFRLYAKSLDEVQLLGDYLIEKQRIQVTTRAAEIELVRSLDSSFAVIFWLIAGAAVFGFVACILSNALAGVKRKSRSLAILRLMGFPGRVMLLMPIWQSWFTGVFGYILSCLLYWLVAFTINSLFAGALLDGQKVCRLLPVHFGLAALLTVGLCGLSSLWAARQAVKIEPAEVIRDV